MFGRLVLNVDLSSSLSDSLGTNSALTADLVVLPHHLSVRSLGGGLGLSSSDGDFSSLSLSHLLLLLHLDSLRLSISLLLSNDFSDSLSFFKLLFHADVLWVQGGGLDDG